MRPGYDPSEETQKVDKTTPFERGLLSLSIGAFVFAVAILAIRGCNAQGQEAPTMLGVEVVYDNPSNQVERTLMKRPAQLVVPPLPPVPSMPRQRMVIRTTNDQMETVIVVIEKPANPPPLPQSRYMTNVFEVACSRCEVVGLRVPKRVEEVGVLSVPGGDELDLTLYFVCCSKEFRASAKVFVKTPVAKPIR